MRELNRKGEDELELSTKQALLDALRAAPDRWQSGAALARLLGVSRNAVWKAAEELRTEGLALESVPRRGYRIGTGGELFTSEEFRTRLGPGWQAEVWPSLTSTNDRARAAAAEGIAGPLLVAATVQTSGRGRRGRAFFSPPGSGLYFSLLLRPALLAVDAPLVTAAAAVAARRALLQFGVQLEIRWVNDLMSDGKKAGGILTESVSNLEDGGLEYLVAGFGLNLTSPADGFPSSLPEAGALFGGELPAGRAQIAAAIALEFEQLIQRLPEADFMSEYREANLLQPGTQVFVSPARGEQYPALVQQIDPSGRLVVKTSDGQLQVLTGGEVFIAE